jgi:hypothetical protein
VVCYKARISPQNCPKLERGAEADIPTLMNCQILATAVETVLSAQVVLNLTWDEWMPVALLAVGGEVVFRIAPGTQ